MKEIEMYNARTASIENAVEELGKRSDLTITDVREFMDLLSTKKISTGNYKKVKVTDVNADGDLVEVEKTIPEKVPLSKIYKYKSDENEIYSRALQKIVENKDFTKTLKGDKCKLSDVLKWLAVNASFVQKDSIPTFVEWVLKTIKDIQNTCTTGKVDTTNQNGMHLILNSTTKGSGKSTFIHKFIEQAKIAGIEARDEVKLPEGGFYNTKAESENLLVGYAERVEQKIDMATLMHIGRREKYDYTEKGKMSIELPSRAITIGSTNGNPYDKGDRCFKVVNCIAADYQTRTNFLTNFYKRVTLEDIRIYTCESKKFVEFVSLFLLDEKSKIIDNNKRTSEINNKLNKLTNFEGVHLLKDLLTECNVAFEDLSWISAKGFGRYYKKCTSKELTFNQLKLLAETFNSLWSFGILKARGPKDDFARQYNLLDIREDILSFEEDLTERTVEDEIREASEYWIKLIDFAESLEASDEEEKVEELNKEEIGEKTMTLGDIEEEEKEKFERYTKVSESVDSMPIEDVEKALLYYMQLLGKDTFESILDSMSDTYYDDETEKHERDMLKLLDIKYKQSRENKNTK